VSQNIEIKDMDYIVREYLLHSGYQESFNAMDIDDGVDSSNIADIEPISHVNGFKKEFSNLSWRRGESSDVHLHEGGLSGIDIPEDYADRVRKYSDNNHNDGIKEPELRKRTLSIMMDRISGKLFLNIR
jgi:hypothetical protein